MAPGSELADPPYELDGSYPGTCVRLQPLRWWPLSLVLLFFGWPSVHVIGSMLHALTATDLHWGVRLAQGVGLLFYIAWHLAFLLPAYYVWAGRLEFRVNVERQRVEVFRGVGRLGWTWAWGFKEVLGLEKLDWKGAAAQGAGPAQSLPIGGFALKTTRLPMVWGLSVKGPDAQRLHELLLHRHPMFHPLQKDPLHS